MNRPIHLFANSFVDKQIAKSDILFVFDEKKKRERKRERETEREERERERKLKTTFRSHHFDAVISSLFRQLITKVKNCIFFLSRSPHHSAIGKVFDLLFYPRRTESSRSERAEQHSELTKRTWCFFFLKDLIGDLILDGATTRG
jgi:hypothetical protein